MSRSSLQRARAQGRAEEPPEVTEALDAVVAWLRRNARDPGRLRDLMWLDVARAIEAREHLDEQGQPRARP